MRIGQAGYQKFPSRINHLGIARQLGGCRRRNCLNLATCDNDGYVGLRIGASSVNQGDVRDRERLGRIVFRAGAQRYCAKQLERAPREYAESAIELSPPGRCEDAKMRHVETTREVHTKRVTDAATEGDCIFSKWLGADRAEGR